MAALTRRSDTDWRCEYACALRPVAAICLLPSTSDVSGACRHKSFGVPACSHCLALHAPMGKRSLSLRIVMNGKTCHNRERLR
jgi:hypothetical protein